MSFRRKYNIEYSKFSVRQELIPHPFQLFVKIVPVSRIL